MIVDCHVNIWNDEHVLPLFHQQLARVRPGSIQMRSDADTLSRVMQSVARAIIFSLRYPDSLGINGDDEVTAAAVQRYPDRFVGFAAVDPRRPDAMELLRYAVEDLGLKGVKFGPIYNGVPLDDPRLVPVYEYCVRNNLPLTMHMGTTFTRQFWAELGNPIHVEPLALRYPDLKIIMAHMGHPWYEECAIVIRKQPNVYAEISAIYYRPWQFYNVMSAIQEYKVADKVFFGSDYPFSDPDEGVRLTRAVRAVTAGTALPPVSEETVETIINSNPFEHWWHGGLSLTP
jgi:predicted TIM-barrel fold metal-dependent hydrolase